jgi:hypothetical protein|tara:strand:- start:513 stop:1241 length:729 start_codon:yes stop_codon:yes gene_type:complete
MLTAKDIIIKPILAKDANNLVKRVHYSGKVVPNSQLHFGVFLQNKLEGAMSFGPPINKKGTINIVKDTSWSGMLELNRMAFSDKLPRNSESRAMSIAFKIIKQNYPQIEWIVSFSDGTQCGDGAIYRAAGFILTDIRQSDALRINPKTNEVMHVIQAHHLMLTKEFKTWKPTIGYQMRYVYFINKDAQKRLNVPIIPFTKIIDIGASMYKGQKIMRIKKQELEDHSNLGGAIPTDTLQLSEL